MHARIMRLFLLTSLTMVAFAANSLLNRMALADGLIGPGSFALIRLVSGAGMLAVLVRMQSGVWADMAEVSVMSVLGLAVYVLGFAYAYQSLDAGLGALILFGVVQVTMFAGAIAAGAPPRQRQWLGAGLAFSGLVWLLLPSSVSPDPWGSLLMAAAGIGWGLFSLYGRGVRRPLQATAANFLLASPLALIPWLALSDTVWVHPAGVALALASGALTSGLGYALWYAVLPELQATRAAIAQLAVPAIAMAGGLLFLGEGASARLLAASVLILGGVALSIRR